jgi:flagellar hook-associated protein 3 FlgL
MVRARELAIQGANGTLTTSNRLMLADQVAELKEQLVSTANARGTRGYLFSGSQTATAAVDAGGVYQGDTAQHRVEIAPGVVTAVTVTGSQAFTAAGGVDAFATLDALEAALRADDTGQVSGTLGDLEASREQITRAQADAGLILNRLDSADEALSISELQHAERAAELGEVDVFAAISELSSLSTALEQAIGVARLTFDNDRQLF